VASALRRSMDTAAVVSLRKKRTVSKHDEQDFLTVLSFFFHAITSLPVHQGLGGGRCAVRSRLGKRGRPARRLGWAPQGRAPPPAG